MGEIVKAVSDATFATDVLQHRRPVLVDFWAQWCGPCRLLSPMLETVAEEQADRLTIVKVNVDENPEVTSRYCVMSLPAIHVFSKGQIVRSIVGFKPKSVLLKEIDDVFRVIEDTGTVPVPGQG